MTISLWEISPLASILIVHIFAEQHEVIAEGEELLKDVLSFLQSTYTSQCLYIPKGTYQKSRFGATKIVLMQVAVK